MGKFKRLKNPSLHDLLTLQRGAQYGELKGVTVGDDVYFWNEVEDNHHADQYHHITKDPNAALYTFGEAFEKHRLTLMPVIEGSDDPENLVLVNGYFKGKAKAVESVRILLSNPHLKQYVVQGNMYIDNPAFYLSDGEPYIKARAYLKQHPVNAFTGVRCMQVKIQDNREPVVLSIADRVHSKVLANEARQRLATVKRRRNELPRFKIQQRRS